MVLCHIHVAGGVGRLHGRDYIPRLKSWYIFRCNHLRMLNAVSQLSSPNFTVSFFCSVKSDTIAFVTNGVNGQLKSGRNYFLEQIAQLRCRRVDHCDRVDPNRALQHLGFPVHHRYRP